MTVFTKSDIVNVLDGEGIVLKKSGRYLRGLCPFHTERTASFFVNPEKNRFRCYGCGASGDSIDFVKQYRGLSFREAVKHLGLDPSWISKPDSRELRKRQAVRDFRAWCYQRHDDLCALYRTNQRAKALCRTETDVERIATYYHQENIWLDEIEILEGRDDEAKLELYQRAL